MEKIIKKLFLSGCLVTAMAISFTALSSSSASAAEQDQKTSQFSVTVPNILTVSNLGFTSDTAGEGTSIKANPAQTKTGTLSATVKSTAAGGFTISLHAATPALTSGTNTIPAATGALTAGTSGWGIKKKPTANTPDTNASTYTAMTTSAVEFYRQTTAQATAKAFNFSVGVATASAQAEGTYSTKVTVTAANI